MLTKICVGNVGSNRKVGEFKASRVWLHINKILFNVELSKIRIKKQNKILYTHIKTIHAQWSQ